MSGVLRLSSRSYNAVGCGAQLLSQRGVVASTASLLGGGGFFLPYQQQQRRYNASTVTGTGEEKEGKNKGDEKETAAAASSASSSSSSSSSLSAEQAKAGAPATGAAWMSGAAWASIGSEFKSVDESKYLAVVPEGFLSPRATTNIQAAEELLQAEIAKMEEVYEGVDVRDPSTIRGYDGNKPKWMTLGTQVKAVAEFMSGHLAHHVNMPEWKELFDLKHIDMDLSYWLYVLHFHLISRRATSVPIEKWSRRRETMEEVLFTMFESWIYTSEEVMGRPPLSKIRNYIKDMYYVTAVNIEEAMMHDQPGGDMMLLGMLIKFCPLPRPEDIPLYTYYTLIHYVRFHGALFDRMSDEQFMIGNFNFLKPNDPEVFKSYNDVELDTVIRQWDAEGNMRREAAEGEEKERQKKQEEEEAEAHAHHQPHDQI